MPPPLKYKEIHENHPIYLKGTEGISSVRCHLEYKSKTVPFSFPQINRELPLLKYYGGERFRQGI